jgi:tetratricopeptide (TPR) repeat protein
LAGLIKELLEYAVRTAEKIEKPALRSLNYTEIAGVYLKNGQTSRCLELIGEALKAANLLKPEEKARQLAWIAGIYIEAGKEADSRELFKRAVLLARAAETPAQKSSALSEIAWEYTTVGLSSEASEIATELYRTVIDPENELDTAGELINIAGIYFDNGQIDQTGEILEEVLRLSESLKDNWFRAERRIETAQIYFDAGNMEKARQILPEALSATNLLEPASQPNFMIRIADIYHRVGDRLRSMEILTSALEIVMQNDKGFSVSGEMLEIAESLAEQEEYAKSAEILTQAQALTGRFDDIKDKIARYTEMAGLWSELGQTKEALDTAQKAWDLCAALVDKRSRVYLLGKLALLYIKLHGKDKMDMAVSLIIQIIKETNVKTAGLGTLAAELSAAGEPVIALRLVDLIREPEVKAGALSGIADSLIDSGQDPESILFFPS